MQTKAPNQCCYSFALLHAPFIGLRCFLLEMTNYKHPRSNISLVEEGSDAPVTIDPWRLQQGPTIEMCTLQRDNNQQLSQMRRRDGKLGEKRRKNSVAVSSSFRSLFLFAKLLSLPPFLLHHNIATRRNLFLFQLRDVGSAEFALQAYRVRSFFRFAQSQATLTSTNAMSRS